MIDLCHQQQKIMQSAGGCGRWVHDPDARAAMAALWGCVVGEHVNDFGVFRDVKEAVRVEIPSIRARAALLYSISLKGWIATGYNLEVRTWASSAAPSVYKDFAFESFAEAVQFAGDDIERMLCRDAECEIEAHRIKDLFGAARDRILNPPSVGLFTQDRRRCRIVQNHWHPEDLHLIDADGFRVPGSRSIYRSIDAAAQDASELGWEVEAAA